MSLDASLVRGVVALLEVLIGAAVALYIAVQLAGIIARPFGDLFNRSLRKLGIPRNVKTGKEGMAGQIAKVVTPFATAKDPVCLAGRVAIKGELWRAKMEALHEDAARETAEVRIERIEGVTLWVSPVRNPAESASGSETEERNGWQR